MNTYILFFYQLIAKILPDTKAFELKNRLLRFAGAEIGHNVRICSSTRILGDGKLSIGQNTWIGHQVLIISSSKISIGSNVDIAPRVYIGTGSHVVDKESLNIAGKGISKDVKIGNGCWLGVGSIVLPGVQIIEKTVIAAGAVVNTSITYQAIYGGIPAKKIKEL